MICFWPFLGELYYPDGSTFTGGFSKGKRHGPALATSIIPVPAFSTTEGSRPKSVVYKEKWAHGKLLERSRQTRNQPSPWTPS